MGKRTVYGTRGRTFHVEKILGSEKAAAYRKVYDEYQTYRKQIIAGMKDHFASEEHLINIEIVDILIDMHEVKVIAKAYVETEEPAVLYLDNSVMNSLLHGKLLSEQEKRQLLIDRGILPANTESNND